MGSENGVPVNLAQEGTLWTYHIGQSVRIKILDGARGTILGRADFGCYQRYLVSYAARERRVLQWFAILEIGHE